MTVHRSCQEALVCVATVLSVVASCSGGRGGPAAPSIAEKPLDISLSKSAGALPIYGVVLVIDHAGPVTAASSVPTNLFRVRETGPNEMRILIAGDLSAPGLLSLSGNSQGVAVAILGVARSDGALVDPSSVSVRVIRRE